MKYAASTSILALALAGCATTVPQTTAIETADAGPAVAAPSGEAMSSAIGNYPLTPEGARAFVQAVEKDLFDYSVIASRAAWVNSTYVTDDTDAVAAYFGTIGTE